MKSLFWVIAEMILVFILLSLPGNQLPDTGAWWKRLPIDKFIHLALFCSLMYSFLYHFGRSTKQSLKTISAKSYTMIVCIVYGIGMEFYQKYFVPSRGFEMADMLADAIGVIVALPLYHLIEKHRKK